MQGVPFLKTQDECKRQLRVLFSAITTVQAGEVDFADCLDIWKQTRAARLEETEWVGARVHSYFIELELG